MDKKIILLILLVAVASSLGTAYSLGATNIIFRTSDGITDHEVMRITSDQRVGIGTNTPQSTLDVNGQITSPTITNLQTQIDGIPSGLLHFGSATAAGSAFIDVDIDDPDTLAVTVPGATSSDVAVCNIGSTNSPTVYLASAVPGSNIVTVRVTSSANGNQVFTGTINCISITP